jgi:hypothetical protein
MAAGVGHFRRYSEKVVEVQNQTTAALQSRVRLQKIARCMEPLLGVFNKQRIRYLPGGSRVITRTLSLSLSSNRDTHLLIIVQSTSSDSEALSLVTWVALMAVPVGVSTLFVESVAG